MKILVTGGAGFIGSHTIIELLNAGHEPIAYDNLCNASPVVFERIKAITGVDVPFIEGDIRDADKLREVFAEHDIDCVIHFAGLKAVGESVEKPIEYYDNNVGGTVKLLEAMRDAGCKNIIFSSSATVYGTPQALPLTEDMPKGEATNPYGRTKSIIEDILADVQRAIPDMNVVLLRYFNPIGAHPSGTMGEDPAGIPNNLMPYITQVAVGKLKQLTIFGDTYDTPDGTGVRDYIHVMDLAEGHLAALHFAEDHAGCEIFNLGTGKGVSVLEMVTTFSSVNGVDVPYIIGERRAGDLATVYADPTKAEQVLGWHAKRTVADMCRDSWNWQKNNPNGYDA